MRAKKSPNSGRHSRLIRIVSYLLLSAFSLSEAAHAAPSDLLSARALQNPAIRFSGTIAKVSDVHQGTSPHFLVHIQDAHTNTGGEKNIAAALEELITRHKITTVFIEGGTKDDSLDFLRSLAPSEARRDVAKKYLMQGELNGAEYLSLASDHSFKIWGVEDAALYGRNVRAYADAADRRGAVLSYVGDMQRAVQTLKRRMYPKDALVFDEFLDKFNKKEKDFTEYHSVLSAQAQKVGVNLIGFPNFLSLKELKDREEKIDFKKANIEQDELARLLSETDIAEHAEKLKAGALSPLPFYETMLSHAREKNIDLSKYPNVTAYTEYLRIWSEAKMDRFISETRILEEIIYQKTLTDDDSFYLHRLSGYLKVLNNLFSLQATREEFDEYSLRQKDMRFSTGACLAFINRKLYDLGNYADTIPIRPLIDDNKNVIEDFYRTTEERDEVFLNKAIQKMKSENIRSAVLITGGFHTQNLKKRMKERNISYAVVTPVVTEETNMKRYEQILLTRAGFKPAASAAGKPGDHVIPQAAAETTPLIGSVMADLRMRGGNAALASAVPLIEGSRLADLRREIAALEAIKDTVGQLNKVFSLIDEYAVRASEVSIRAEILSLSRYFTLSEEAIKTYSISEKDGESMFALKYLLYRNLLQGKAPVLSSDLSGTLVNLTTRTFYPGVKEFAEDALDDGPFVVVTGDPQKTVAAQFIEPLKNSKIGNLVTLPLLGLEYCSGDKGFERQALVEGITRAEFEKIEALMREVLVSYETRLNERVAGLTAGAFGKIAPLFEARETAEVDGQKRYAMAFLPLGKVDDPATKEKVKKDSGDSASIQSLLFALTEDINRKLTAEKLPPNTVKGGSTTLDYNPSDKGRALISAMGKMGLDPAVNYFVFLGDNAADPLGNDWTAVGTPGAALIAVMVGSKKPDLKSLPPGHHVIYAPKGDGELRTAEFGKEIVRVRRVAKAYGPQTAAARMASAKFETLSDWAPQYFIRKSIETADELVKEIKRNPRVGEFLIMPSGRVVESFELYGAKDAVEFLQNPDLGLGEGPWSLTSEKKTGVQQYAMAVRPVQGARLSIQETISASSKVTAVIEKLPYPGDAKKSVIKVRFIKAARGRIPELSFITYIVRPSSEATVQVGRQIVSEIQGRNLNLRDDEEFYRLSSAIFSLSVAPVPDLDGGRMSAMDAGKAAEVRLLLAAAAKAGKDSSKWPVSLQTAKVYFSGYVVGEGPVRGRELTDAEALFDQVIANLPGISGWKDSSKYKIYPTDIGIAIIRDTSAKPKKKPDTDAARLAKVDFTLKRGEVQKRSNWISTPEFRGIWTIFGMKNIKLISPINAVGFETPSGAIQVILIPKDDAETEPRAKVKKHVEALNAAVEAVMAKAKKRIVRYDFDVAEYQTNAGGKDFAGSIAILKVDMVSRSSDEDGARMAALDSIYRSQPGLKAYLLKHQLKIEPHTERASLFYISSLAKKFDFEDFGIAVLGLKDFQLKLAGDADDAGTIALVRYEGSKPAGARLASYPLSQTERIPAFPLQRMAFTAIPLRSLSGQKDEGIGDPLVLAEFLDVLSTLGLHWEDLPINPTSPSDASPFSSTGAFGADTIHIAVRKELEGTPSGSQANLSYDTAAADGTLDRLRATESVRMEEVRAFKMKVLREEFERLYGNGFFGQDNADGAAFRDFVEKNSYWILDHAVFNARQEMGGWNTAWENWSGRGGQGWSDEGLKSHRAADVEAFVKENQKDVLFQQYLQWVFIDKQWKPMRSHAQSKKTLLKGDIPMYVGRNSADVWAHQELFNLKEEGGAPPDAFTPLAQGWGNPTYNWEAMKADGYRWWMERFKFVFEMYDVVRIDHFRGLEAFWAIPQKSEFYESIRSKVAANEAAYKPNDEAVRGALTVLSDRSGQSFSGAAQALEHFAPLTSVLKKGYMAKIGWSPEYPVTYSEISAAYRLAGLELAGVAEGASETDLRKKAAELLAHFHNEGLNSVLMDTLVVLSLSSDPSAGAVFDGLNERWMQKFGFHLSDHQRRWEGVLLFHENLFGLARHADAEWKPAPGSELLNLLNKEILHTGLYGVVGENLGKIDTAVETVRRESGVPGMAVEQFGWNLGDAGGAAGTTYDPVHSSLDLQDPNNQRVTTLHDLAGMIRLVQDAAAKTRTGEARPESVRTGLFIFFKDHLDYLRRHGQAQSVTDGDLNALVTAMMESDPSSDANVNAIMKAMEWVNEAVLLSPAAYTSFFFPDLVGISARINTPGTVGSHNWRLRLRRRVEELKNWQSDPVLRPFFESVKNSVAKYGRNITEPWNKGDRPVITAFVPKKSSAVTYRSGETVTVSAVLLPAAGRGDLPAMQVLTNMPAEDGAQNQRRAIPMQPVKELPNGTILYQAVFSATRAGQYYLDAEVFDNDVWGGTYRSEAVLRVTEPGARLVTEAPADPLQTAVLKINEWKKLNAGVMDEPSRDNPFVTKLQEAAQKLFDTYRLYRLPYKDRKAFIEAVFDAQNHRSVHTQIQSIYKEFVSDPNGTATMSPGDHQRLAQRFSAFEQEYNIAEYHNIRAAAALLFDFFQNEVNVLEQTQVVAEIEKELRKPGSGNLQMVAAIQDIHNGFRRLAALVGFVMGFPADAYRDISSMEDFKHFIIGHNINPSILNLRIVGLADQYDRGPDPVAVAELVQWIREQKKGKTFLGNHDFWRAMGVLQVHRIFADRGVDFHDKENEGHHIAYWAEEAFVHSGWGDIELDQVNQKNFNRWVDRLNQIIRIINQKLPAGEKIQEFEKIDLAEVRGKFDTVLKAKKARNAEIRKMKQAAPGDAAVQATPLEVLPDIFEETSKAVAQAIDSSNARILEINRLHRERGADLQPSDIRIATLVNYHRDPEVIGRTLNDLKNFRLFYVDLYGNLHMHNIVPVKPEGGFDVSYGGRGGLEALELMSQRVREFFEPYDTIPDDRVFREHMWEQLGEIFEIINSWYSDKPGYVHAKAENVEKFIKAGGLARFGAGILGHATQTFAPRSVTGAVILGHNERKKFKDLGLPAIYPYPELGTAIINIDYELSPGYSDRGAILTVFKRDENGRITGLRLWGFRKGSETIEDMTFDDTKGLEPEQLEEIKKLHDGVSFMNWYRLKSLRSTRTALQSLIIQAEAKNRYDKAASFRKQLEAIEAKIAAVEAADLAVSKANAEIQAIADSIMDRIDRDDLRGAVQILTKHRHRMPQSVLDIIAQKIKETYRGPIKIVGKVGGTSISFEASTADGLLGHRVTVETNAAGDTEQDVVDRIAQAVNRVIQYYGDANRVQSVYFTAPGFFDLEGKLAAKEPNIPALNRIGFSFKDSVGGSLANLAPRNEALGAIPVTVVHDGTGAALGETSVFGTRASEADSDLFFIIAGTGIGTRRLVQGKPFFGGEEINYLINEIPHLLLFNGNPQSPDFRFFGLETRGSSVYTDLKLADGNNNPDYIGPDLEDRTSGPAIASYARSEVLRITSDASSVSAEKPFADELVLQAGKDLKNIDAKLLGIAANQGNLLAERIIRERARELGIGIAVSILVYKNQYDVSPPDHVIIGSGVAQIGAIFLQAVREGARKHFEQAGTAFDVDRIVLSEIQDDTAREFLGGLPTPEQISAHQQRLQLDAARLASDTRSDTEQLKDERTAFRGSVVSGVFGTSAFDDLEVDPVQAAARLGAANADKFGSETTRYPLLVSPLDELQVLNIGFALDQGAVSVTFDGGQRTASPFVFYPGQFSEALATGRIDQSRTPLFAAKANRQQLLSRYIGIWNSSEGARSVWSGAQAQIADVSTTKELVTVFPLSLISSTTDFENTVSRFNQMASAQKMKLTIRIATEGSSVPEGVAALIRRINSSLTSHRFIEIEVFDSAKGALFSDAVQTVIADKNGAENLSTGATKILVFGHGSTSDEISGQLGSTEGLSGAMRNNVLLAGVQSPDRTSPVSFAVIFVASVYRALDRLNAIPSTGMFDYEMKEIRGLGFVMLFRFNLDKEMNDLRLAKQAEIAA